MAIADGATLVVVLLAIASILLLIDLQSHASCPQCPHCKAASEEERKLDSEKRHAMFHQYWDRTPVAECKNPKCPGR